MPALRNEWREPLRAQREPLANESGRVRSNREQHRNARKQTKLGRFVRTYGWRAYALPILAVWTAVALYMTFAGTTEPQTQEPEGPVQGPPTIGVASTGPSGSWVCGSVVPAKVM